MKKEKTAPEMVQISFVDLGQFKTAKEIAAMPYSKINETVEAQERQFNKNETMGGRAVELVARLRAGDQLRAHILPATRRFEVAPADGSAPIPVKAAIVEQLAGRGWLAGVPNPPKPAELTLEQAQAICGTT